MQTLLNDLTNGNPQNLKEAVKNESSKHRLSLALTRDPQALLKCLQDIPGAASIVAALITKENACILASVCRETILSAGHDLTLYVSVFTHLTKYDIPDVANTLVPLLSSPYAEQVTLCLAAWVKSSDGAELCACVQDLCKEGDHFDAVAAAFETFFPLVPALVPVYTSPECKKLMMERAACMQDTQTLLRLVSISCMYEAARKFNKESYLTLLIQGAREASGGEGASEGEEAQKEQSRASISALSLLCIVKLWNFSAVETQMPLSEIVSRLRDLFLTPVHQYHQYILEAFTYLSLGKGTRQKLRADEEITNQLVLVMETTKAAETLYAGLLTLASLTRSSTPTEASGIKKAVTKDEESVQDIQRYNQALVSEYKLVQTLCALPLQAKDLNLASQRVVIIHNITALQSSSIQREAVAQGALPVLLKFLIENHVRTKATASGSDYFGDSEPLLFCVRALANLCRSADPRLAFSKYDVKTCVPFLVELLRNSDNPGISLLDKLYGLQALTNVSSLSEPELHALIIGKTGDLLPDMFLDSVPEIQKAVWELVNNVITHPRMLAKFFNTENSASRKNLDILVKLLHSKDPALQVIISGILANSTMEYALVCRCLLEEQEKQLSSIICDILRHQYENEDLVSRLVVLVYNLKIADEKSDFFGASLEAELRKLLRVSQDRDVLDMVKEIVSK